VGRRADFGDHRLASVDPVDVPPVNFGGIDHLLQSHHFGPSQMRRRYLVTMLEKVIDYVGIDHLILPPTRERA
jgi:hypothetical protein